MTKPARDLGLADLQVLIDLEAPESDTLELKADLSVQKDVHGWRAKGELHRGETKSLAKEVVALANTYGGRIFVGIAESKDMPRRASSLSSPLPAIHDLVERLRDSLNAIIEPPIAGLGVLPIPCPHKSSEGFIVIDVPRSAAAPHGFGSPPECYWRRDSTSRPMAIADLHNSFWEARTRRERVNGEIANAEQRLVETTTATSDTFAYRFTVISENTLEMQDLVAGLRRGDVYSNLTHSYFGATTHPMYSSHDWAFSFFGATKKENTSDPRGHAEWRIDETGVVEVSGYYFESDPAVGIVMDVEAFCGSAAHALQLAGSLGRFAHGGNNDRWIVSAEFHCGHRRAAVKNPQKPSQAIPVPFRRFAKLRPLIFDLTRSPDTTFTILENKVWAAFGLPVREERRYRANLG
ncbi:helix-turn-helix domain-containing protein [Rhizobium phaseoli]|uniref:AlbA family DNA-binding domain-containing protein n=1 Tax=Rhizobium phaseoli TaxID=396 RepID=UPI0007EC04D5|nr:ATP-binding protein [Rhizobium phaseoli]